jgi:hypothetical protein
MLEPQDIARMLRDTTADAAFIDLLQRANISLIAALRPAGVACFGVQDGALFMSFTRTQITIGLATDGKRLAIGGRREIAVFAPSTRLAEHLPGKPKHHDVLFVPVNTYRTGECMAHERWMGQASSSPTRNSLVSPAPMASAVSCRCGSLRSSRT